MVDETAGRLEQDAVRRLLDRTLTETMDRLGSHAGGIHLVEPGGEIVSIEVCVGVPPEFIGPLTRVTLSSNSDPVAEAVRERRTIWLSSGEPHLRRYPQPARAVPHLFAVVITPIATGATVWGAMVLTWPHGRPPELSASERRGIGTAVDRLARLLKDADETGHRIVPGPQPRYLPVERRDRAGETEAHAAADFVARLPEGGCALAPDGRITFIDHAAADLVGESIGSLLGARLWEVLPWLEDPVYEHRHRDAVFGQHPTSFTAVRPPDRYLLFQLYPDPTGISVRITPAPAHHPQGAEPTAGAGPGPTRLGAIYHLMHLAGALTEAATVRDIVDLLTDRWLLTFGAQAFALLVPEASRLQIIGHRGVTADLLHRLDHLSETSNALGLLGLAGRTPSFFSSPAELRAAHPALADIDSGMAAWAILPLIASGQRAGLCLLAYDVPHRFTTEERLTFTSLSALVAQALDRTRVYDAKHQIAHGLQAGLLPHNLPEIPGLRVAARYLPASHGMDIGGDFYDLIRVSTTDAAAVIGDVQGHNVRAAALMGQIRAAVHAYVVSGAPPGQILAHTNRLLTDLDPDLLTSCLYARLDLARQRAHLATAGHWPPLVRRPDLRAEVLPMVPGPLLGVDAAAVYPTIEIATPPGTLLAFYTDGLIETPGQDTDLTDLAMALSRAGDDLDDIADTLLDRAQPSGNRADDTALLLLRTAAPGA